MPEYITIEIGDDGVGRYFRNVYRQVLAHYLENAHGNIARSAKMMQIDPSTLRRQIEEYQLESQLVQWKQEGQAKRQRQRQAETHKLRAAIEQASGNFRAGGRLCNCSPAAFRERVKRHGLLEYARRLRCKAGKAIKTKARPLVLRDAGRLDRRPLICG